MPGSSYSPCEKVIGRIGRGAVGFRRDLLPKNFNRLVDLVRGQISAMKLNKDELALFVVQILSGVRPILPEQPSCRSRTPWRPRSTVRIPERQIRILLQHVVEKLSQITRAAHAFQSGNRLLRDRSTHVSQSHGEIHGVGASMGRDEAEQMISSAQFDAHTGLARTMEIFLPALRKARLSQSVCARLHCATGNSATMPSASFLANLPVASPPRTEIWAFSLRKASRRKSVAFASPTSVTKSGS